MGALSSRFSAVVSDRTGMLAGDVLNQRATQSDIQHLYAATDRERRQSPLPRPVEQRQLRGIAPGMNGAQVRMGLGAIPRGCDVLAAGQHQSRNDIQNRVSVRAGR